MRFRLTTIQMRCHQVWPSPKGVCFLAVLILSVHGISDKTLKTIRQKEDIVSGIAAQASGLFERRALAIRNCDCSLHSCAYDFPGAECHETLGPLTSLCGEDCRGQLIDYNQTIFRMPPGTDPKSISPSLKQSICTYRGLEDFFFGLFPRAFAWTYIGTTDGHFRRWPAAGRTHSPTGDPFFNGCSPYDPRTRPWYIAASTGPKDIVFIIDKSLSMLDPQIGGAVKWNVTTAALSAVIDTLGNLDYFNVVAFSDDAEQLYTTDNLAQGTSDNKELVQEALSNQYPTGGTNFDAAFKLAFSLLTNACDPERKTCSKCEKVILFLTDGKDTSRQLDGGIKPSEMASKIAAYQDTLEEMTSRRASIFTFSMGRDADDSIPRQIACNNDGSWSYIRDTDDPLTAMRSYYLFLTARRVSGSPIWVEPYEDASGLGMLTTVATPIFSRGTVNLTGAFLGVAGHDVLFDELGVTESERDSLLNELIERGSKCQPLLTDKCQLQVMRNVQANGATCIDRFPIRTVPSSERDQPQCFTNGRSFYKRFSSLVEWDEAADRCVADGGQLTSVGSQEELAFIANMASDDGSWIGARRDFSNRFVWLEGSSADLDIDSPYWGIGQPDSFQGVEDCVSIDTRGPIGNLNDVKCDKQYTFICEYDTDDSCKGTVLNPREQAKQYFSVPPVELCVNAEASLARADTLDAANSLNSDDVMCSLGEPRPDAEFRCCQQCVPNISPQTIDTAIINESTSTTSENSAAVEASSRDVGTVTNSNSPEPESDSGVSGTTVIIIAVVLIVVLGLVFMCGWFKWAFTKRNETKSTQTRSVGGEAMHTPSTQQPPQPRSPSAASSDTFPSNDPSDASGVP